MNWPNIMLILDTYLFLRKVFENSIIQWESKFCMLPSSNHYERNNADLFSLTGCLIIRSIDIILGVSCASMCTPRCVPSTVVSGMALFFSFFLLWFWLFSNQILKDKRVTSSLYFAFRINDKQTATERVFFYWYSQNHRNLWNSFLTIQHHRISNQRYD